MGSPEAVAVRAQAVRESPTEGHTGGSYVTSADRWNQVGCNQVGCGQGGVSTGKTSCLPGKNNGVDGCLTVGS